MNNVWFTADLHFNHTNILKVRPQFKSVEEMNETIVENWNRVVKKGDRIYVLGDVALGKPLDARMILSRLEGQKYLIRGNHDVTASHNYCRGFFIWTKDYEYITIGEQGIVLCHYAFKSWNKMHYGTWNLHGHSHGTLKADPFALQLDVGVDCHKYSPIEFETIRTLMASKRFAPVDHHSAAPAGAYPWEKTDENSV